MSFIAKGVNPGLHVALACYVSTFFQPEQAQILFWLLWLETHEDYRTVILSDFLQIGSALCFSWLDLGYAFHCCRQSLICCHCSLVLSVLEIHMIYNYISFFFFNLFYLFLAALGLCCCARAFSSCGEQGLLFVVVHGLFIAVASLVGEHGL